MRKLRRWWPGRRRAPRHPPCFVPAGESLVGWLQALRGEGIRLAVLQEPEPSQVPCDGRPPRLVLLAADEAIATVRARGAVRGKVACELYSLHGAADSHYRGLAFLPVSCGEWLLEQADSDPVGRLPPEARLRVEAFHQVYHLGEAPLGSRLARLQALAETCPDDGPAGLTLDALDAWLAERGWRPLWDTLEKLAGGSPWVAQWLGGQALAPNDPRRGLGVFLVRERGVEALEMVRQRLFDEGFDLLAEGAVDGAAHPEAIRDIRGGNWSRGPWPESGGLPAYYLVVHDVLPLAVSEELRAKHPGLDNARLLKAKLAIRDGFNAQRPVSAHCNILHSSDNGRQALAYLEALAPASIASLVDAAEALQSAFRCPYPVLEVLGGNSRRAKVELIDFHGQQAVCKTFRRGRERFLEREVEARRLGGDLPEISRLLEVGPNYLVFEYYHNAMAEIAPRRPLLHPYPVLPLWVVKRLQEVIRHYRRLGYECIDLKPGNLLFDPEQGLKVIDFEFLQEGGHRTDRLVGNLVWYPPRAFKGDLPSLRHPRNLYYRRWFRHTALPRFFCLHSFPEPVLISVRAVTFGYLSAFNLCRAMADELGLLQQSARS